MYKPRPINTSNIKLPDEITQLTEQLAEHNHDLWASQRLAEGWRYGPMRDDAKREHPCLVPYEELPESEKQYDRNAAMETLKAILVLGYQIESPTPNSVSPAAPSAYPSEADFLDQHRVDTLLNQLHASGTKVLDLLEAYQAKGYEKLWQQNARLYRAFGKSLIAGGYPTKAFELVREGLGYHATDSDLQYVSALALARGGNVSKATEYINELLQDRGLDQRLKIEALSLAGRLAKDQYQRAHKAALKTKFARESARLYACAHQRSSASFPGINAALGYSSVACGSDILFAEEMLKRGAELHIVLPFDKSDFYYQDSKSKPAFCNTWGDGLYLVFDSVIDCADFAMRLLERIEKVQWEKVGLPADTTVRIGIHAGPVYPRMDKIIKRNNFFGSHVNRAARIEPVTTRE